MNSDPQAHEEDQLPSNSASRVLKLLQSAAGKSSAGTALEAWAEVLGTTALSDEERLRETVLLLADLKKEIDNAVRLLRKRGYTTTATTEPAARAHAATSVSNLSANWGALKERIGPDTILQWRIFAESIGMEDWEIPEQQLNEMFALLSELRDRLSKEGLPSDLRDFITQQIALIEHALRRYVVRGVAVFAEVVGQAMAVWAEYENVDLHQHSETHTLIKRVWTAVLTWGARVRSIEAIARAGRQLLQLGSGNLPDDPLP